MINRVKLKYAKIEIDRPGRCSEKNPQAEKRGTFMRWQIAETKRKIVSYDFLNHKDDIEMSGEQVSAVITYKADENNNVSFGREIFYPMIRTHPDVTQSSYRAVDNDFAATFFGEEKFVKAEINGVLSVFTETDECEIVHRFFPSLTEKIFYEMIEVKAKKDGVRVSSSRYKKVDTLFACEGRAYTERVCREFAEGETCKTLSSGESITLLFAYSARFYNQPIPSEENPFEKRVARVNELLSECDLTTGDDVIDTMFAFAKIRVGESIYRTRKGRVNSPGGTNYYAAIWCNDQSEYSTPWFGFTGDKILLEAARNAMLWFEPYMNDEFEPVPCSIFSEGTDFWNAKGDRGDSSMWLFGNSRLFLERGILPDEREKRMFEWFAEFTERQITADDVVFSDTDELENRLSSGINLSTSSLAYGAFGCYAVLLERMGEDEKAKHYRELQKRIRKGVENYFGGTVSGYETYHYNKGCDEIRAWNTLPAYMGITERWKGSADAIDDKLWCKGGCRSSENEEILWDRSALYYIAALFRMDDKERAYSKLREMSEIRLLGERVPYVVEAYPEFNMRHLSAESALMARTITDGLLDISFDKCGFSVNPHLPNGMKKVEMNRIFLCGKYVDITVENGKTTIKDSVV
mgnify:CR=1 FL=1